MFIANTLNFCLEIGINWTRLLFLHHYNHHYFTVRQKWAKYLICHIGHIIGKVETNPTLRSFHFFLKTCKLEIIERYDLVFTNFASFDLMILFF